MSKTIAALYPSRTRAQQVIVDLRKVGVPDDRINILSHQALEERSDGTHTATKETSNDIAEVGEGAAAGSVGGAVGGALAAIGLALIPGVGWIAAAGPIIGILGSAAAGAGIGAVAGGIAGGLSDTGVSKADADIYAEALRRGGSLVLLTVADRNEARVTSILERHDPIDTDATVARWRAEGWKKYDHKAKPYDTTKADAERALMQKESARTRHAATPGQRDNTTSRKVETLKGVEEDVSISKRDTASGEGVRARSYVVETPVEEELTLVDESVSVERNKVNKPVGSGVAERALSGGEKVVEMQERHERAVVDKKARVTEEVEVAKTHKERDRTVRATERERRVEIENHPTSK